MTYSGLTALVIAKDLVTDPTSIIAMMTPIVALWTYDKIQSHVSDSSRGE
tara:strand:- start:334 stop:483 length:150 start_codon:yes stop_codon:yes gene_type:complete